MSEIAEGNSTDKMKRVFKRKSISLHDKISMLDMFKNGKRTCEVAKLFGLNESTVRTIRQNEDKIRTLAATGATTFRRRSAIMDKMEQELLAWIEDNIQKEIQFDSIIVKQKALEIFNCLKGMESFSENLEFVASKTWFDNFRKRFSLVITPKIQDKDEEDVSVDVDSNNYFTELSNIIGEHEYLAQQIFREDETSILIGQSGESLNETNNEEQFTKVEPNIEDSNTFDNSINNTSEGEEDFSIELLKEGLDLAQQLDSFFTLNDPSCERASLFKRDLYQCLSPYLELYRQLHKKGKLKSKIDKPKRPKVNHSKK